MGSSRRRSRRSRRIREIRGTFRADRGIRRSSSYRGIERISSSRRRSWSSRDGDRDRRRHRWSSRDRDRDRRRRSYSFNREVRSNADPITAPKPAPIQKPIAPKQPSIEEVRAKHEAELKALEEKARAEREAAEKKKAQEDAARESYNNQLGHDRGLVNSEFEEGVFSTGGNGGEMSTGIDISNVGFIKALKSKRGEDKDKLKKAMK